MSEDWEVDETETSSENEEYKETKFEIINYPADITLKGYVDQWRNKQLEIPKFQRNYVWDISKASKLIESFLIGLPVPGVFFFRSKNSDKLKIVDGQQRILSVIKYLDEKFDERQIFKLKNVSSSYEGKRFGELSDDVRFKLETSVLRATVIQQITPNNDTSIYQIFERLNTGGMNLNAMEIRQSVSYGEFIEFLKRCNSDERWQAILGRRKIDNRLRDLELLLRCFAFAEYIKEYEKPMKEFLNRYIEIKKNNNDFNELYQSFDSALDMVTQFLPEKPFHLRGRLNYGALDSVFSNLITGKFDPLNINRNFNDLINDENYIKSISFNTSDNHEISTRIKLANEYLSRQ